MPQPSPVSAKPETQATPVTKNAEPKTAPTKAEPTPVATKSQPTPAPIDAVPTVPTPKAKMEPTSVKKETTAVSAQIKLETTPIPTTAKVSPVTAEKLPLAASTKEPIMPTMAPVQQTVVTPKVEVLYTDVSKTVTVGDKEDVVKMELSVTEFSQTKESKPDLSKVKVEPGVDAALCIPVTEATPITPSPIPAEVAMAAVFPRTETKPELSAPERIIKEIQPDDQIKGTETTKSLQQVEVRPMSQEQQLELVVEPIIVADNKEVADKLVEKIIDATSTPETQPVSTENIIIKVRTAPLD